MRKLKLISFALCLVLLSATTALAAGDGHELPWGNFAFRILNFALFAGLICLFFGKKIKAALKGRTQGIADEISTLESRKAEAQARLADVEKRIADLDQERENILLAYREQGEALKAEIIAQAEKTARQMMEQAKSSADNDVAQTVSAMRAQMADEIVAAAEKIIAKKMTPAEQEKLMDKSLSRVVLN